MTADNIFAELALVIAIATGVALVMRLIRQPLIIGHILTGILVGPAALHLIKSPATIETFSNIGIALLLFIIGLGLNPKAVRDVGKVTGFIAIIQVALVTAFAWAGAVLFGHSYHEAIFIGLALSFSSTIIILKLLSDKREQTRLYGKLAIGLLIMQDLIAMIALLFVTAQHGQNGLSVHQLALLALKGLAIATGLFVGGFVILPRFQRLVAGSQEFLFLFALGWAFGAAALFAKAGFSLEVGALLAGVSLASLPYAQEMSARLRPLRDFFVVVFFISLGTQLTFGSIGHLLPLILFSIGVVILLKPLIVLCLLALFGYTKRTSFKTALSTSQISEFSLVLILLGHQQGLVSGDLVSALTFVALITIAVSTYATLYNDQLYKRFEKYLAFFERERRRFERETKTRYDMILLGYKHGGHEFIKVFESLKKPFTIVDYDPDTVEMLEHQKLPVIFGDATDIELLEEIGLDKTKLVISTVNEHSVNVFVVSLLAELNPHCVVIVHADSVEQATELYGLGASYVMMPHYIGSEKIGAFIKQHGFDQKAFHHYRDQQLNYIQHNYSFETEAYNHSATA